MYHRTVRRIARRNFAKVEPTRRPFGPRRVLDDGGHFAAIDAPDAVVADRRSFFASVTA